MDDLISRLSELRCQYNCFDENERDAYHTLSEAIKALSDVPDTNVGDTISRQDAIDVLKRNYPSSCFEDLCKAVDIAIKALSAQPEITEEDAREWCYKRGLAIIDNALYLEMRNRWSTSADVQPVRHGHWMLYENQNQDDVNNGNYLYVCSNCNYSDIHAKTVEVPFCWHCGARMDGERDG